MRWLETMTANDPRQLGLFDDRTTRMESVRRALADFDLIEAIRQLGSCLARYPGDADARKSLNALTLLSNRLIALEAEKGEPILALLHLGEELGEVDRKGWHRRLATEAEALYGSGCDIARIPVGLHWLAAGNLDRAAQSLRDSLQVAPKNARSIAYLGDVLFLGNKVQSARVQYLRAFLLDPATIDLSHIADPEVESLAWVAENEYAIRGDCLEWVASVGTVEAVFPLPPRNLPGLAAVPADTDSPVNSTPGRSFYALIVEEQTARSTQEKIPIRQKMKALCPLLFKSYFERYVNAFEK